MDTAKRARPPTCATRVPPGTKCGRERRQLRLLSTRMVTQQRRKMSDLPTTNVKFFHAMTKPIVLQVRPIRAVRLLELQPKHRLQW